MYKATLDSRQCIYNRLLKLSNTIKVAIREKWENQLIFTLQLDIYKRKIALNYIRSLYIFCFMR
jgi:hypothetical protein